MREAYVRTPVSKVGASRGSRFCRKSLHELIPSFLNSRLNWNGLMNGFFSPLRWILDFLLIGYLRVCDSRLVSRIFEVALNHHYGIDAIRKNIAHFVLGKALTAVFSVVVLLLIARVLPVQQFAAYTIFQALISLVNVISDSALGRPSYAISRVESS